MKCLKIKNDDNVAVVVETLKPGDVVEVDGRTIEVKDDIERFHKMAVDDITYCEDIIKYGVPVGRSLRDILAGEKVHLHNMESKYIHTYSRKNKEIDE